MHSLAVKSNLIDSCPETTKIGFGGNDMPVCPKPRRLGSALPEFLKPLKCSKHSQPSSDGRSAILNIIADKATDGHEPICTGCLSASCYSGSPPRRTDNPLVQDVQFIHRWGSFSHLHALSSMTTSASPLPLHFEP